MTKKTKTTEPEDIGVKFGSGDMVFWQNVIGGIEIGLKHDKESLEAMKNNIKYNEAVLVLAKEKFKEAEKEFKK